MPITTWIRDLLGIPKDVIDLKKSKLELERLEEEKQERDLVSRATLDDVKKYDPKYRSLEDQIERTPRTRIPPHFVYWHSYRGWIFGLVVLTIIVILVYRACV